jgi:hypothetical protein
VAVVAVGDRDIIFHKVLAVQAAVVMVDLQLEAMVQMGLPTQVAAEVELVVMLTIP